MAFIDTDEFLVLQNHRHQSLPAFLRGYEDYGGEQHQSLAQAAGSGGLLPRSPLRPPSLSSVWQGISGTKRLHWQRQQQQQTLVQDSQAGLCVNKGFQEKGLARQQRSPKCPAPIANSQ